MSDSTNFRTLEVPIEVNPPPPQELPLISAVLAAAGVIVLIGSEIWLVAVASIWALHGLLAANLAVDIILAIFILPIAVWASWKIGGLAIAAERNPENWA